MFWIGFAADTTWARVLGTVSIEYEPGDSKTPETIIFWELYSVMETSICGSFRTVDSFKVRSFLNSSTVFPSAFRIPAFG